MSVSHKEWDKLITQLESREGKGAREASYQGQEGWRNRLEELQTQHKRESIKQQRLHLDQLHILQNQLLEEISRSVDLTEHYAGHLPQDDTAVETNHCGVKEPNPSSEHVEGTPPPSLVGGLGTPGPKSGDVTPAKMTSSLQHRQELGEEGLETPEVITVKMAKFEGGLENAKTPTEKITQHGGQVTTTNKAMSLHHRDELDKEGPETLQLREKLEEEGLETAEVTTAKMTSSLQHREKLEKDLTKLQHELEEEDLETAEAKMAQLVQNQRASVEITEAEAHHQHETDSVQSHEMAHYLPTGAARLPIAAMNYDVESGRTTHPHPADKGLEPATALLSDSDRVAPDQTPVSRNHTISWCPMPQTLPQTKFRSASHVMSPNQQVFRSYDRHLSRQLLMEKHAKHIEDLKRYYGAEIASLSEKLTAMEDELNRSPPVRQKLNFDELHMSPMQCLQYDAPWEMWDKGEGGAEMQALKDENVRLKKECGKLKEKLAEKIRKCETLEEQQNQAEEHVLEWQDHCRSSEKLIAMLKERLEGIRMEVREQDSYKGKLQNELHVAREELRSCKLLAKQDNTKMKELFHRFEELQVENSELHQANADYEEGLKVNATEVAALRASIGNHKMMEAKYKNSIRGLEDEVRHLEHVKNRMYSMGTHYELGAVSPTRDAEMRRNTTPSKVHTRHPLPSSYLPSSSLPIPSSHTHQSVTKEPPIQITPDKLLTRRKWLESSDPSLFGTTPNSYSTDKSNRDSIFTVTTSTPIQNRNFKDNSAQGSPRKDSSAYDNTRRDGSAYENTRRNSSPYEGHRKDSLAQGGKRENKVMDKLEMTDREKTKCAELVADTEQKLDKLITEKDMLESCLRRTSRAKSIREIRQAQFAMEERLEDVMHEIGSARMILKQHHVLGTRKASTV